jgi:predicted phage-related endonuclease
MAVTRTEITSEQQWHDLRKPNIGASEIGALLGVHEYCTPYSLSARKLGLLEVVPDNAILRRGRLLEPVAIQLLQEEKPEWQLTRPHAYYCDQMPRLGATPDLFVVDENNRRGVVQIKSVEPSVFARAWHDSETGEVVPPTWIAVQAMMEAHLTNSEFAFIAALVVGHGIHLELIEVPIREDVIRRLYERAAIFWHQVDHGKTLDPDFSRDGAAIAEVLRRDDETELDFSADNELPDIASRLEAAQTAKKMCEETIENCKARILHRIGAAAKVKFAGGLISAKTVYRKEHMVSATSYRRLTVHINRGNGAGLSEAPHAGSQL